MSIIPMKENEKTDAELVDILSSNNRKMRRLLNNANSLLRSALSIDQRSGQQTFWEAFKTKVENELKEQQIFFNESQVGK